MRRFALVLLVLAAGCSRTPPPSSSSSATVRITQFYTDAVVPKGETANLCYGVENAKTVELDPPIEKLWPAVARCIKVDPAKGTTYKLTADDGQGHAVSQTVQIRIGPPRPKIIEVSINKTEVDAGELVTVCYKARNATSVEAAPGKWINPHTNDLGCLADHPAKDTTYHVRIKGGEGQMDAEQVTVHVRPSTRL